jgi:glycerophosphoryl diester phosphodiesterase
MSDPRMPPAWAVDYDRWPYPDLVAHRGAGRLAPENTLAAIRLGASLGHTMFEFDVKLTADGKPVLLHDATLERTTDGTGPAGMRTLAEIAQLDAGSWHSATFAGEPVPTFGNVARWLRANRLMANVEIKPSPGREAETGALVAIAAAIAWRDVEVPPLLSSFSETALQAARDVVPGLPRALLLGARPDDWLARCLRSGCVAVDADHRALDASVVARAHGAGLRVLTYTVDEPDRVLTLRAWGVDAVITDAVDRLRPTPADRRRSG